MAAATGATLQPTAVPIIRGEGDGERLWFAGGGVFTMKATAAETNGTFMLFEDRMTRGKVTPLHLHPHAEETLIVLEGELVVYHAGSEHRVGPGGVAVVPRGVPHAFMVTSETARILALLTPGSGEAFYRAASEPVTDDTDPQRPPDWNRLRTAAEQHPESIQILGPPPFVAGR
jgi:quercetin dioxygenase-like cupin family protein